MDIIKVLVSLFRLVKHSTTSLLDFKNGKMHFHLEVLEFLCISEPVDLKQW